MKNRIIRIVAIVLLIMLLVPQFAAIAESADYNTLDELLAGFDEKMANNAEHGLFVISSGCARFDPRTDNSFSSVFERADEMMYIRKRLLKQT